MSASDDGGDLAAHAHSPQPTGFQQGVTLTRRQAIQAAAMAGAAGMLGAASSGTVAADDDVPFSELWWLTVHGWMNFYEQNDILTDSSTAQGNALWDEIHADAVEMELRRHESLVSVEREIEMLANYLRYDYLEQIWESTQDGKSEQEVEDDAVQLLENAVSNIDISLFNNWTLDFMGYLRRHYWAFEDDTGDIDMGSVFRVFGYMGDKTLGSDNLYPEWSSRGVYFDTEEDELVGLYNEFIDTGAEDDVADWDSTGDFEFGVYYQSDMGNTAESFVDYHLPNGDTIQVPVLSNLVTTSGDDHVWGGVAITPFGNLSNDQYTDNTGSDVDYLSHYNDFLHEDFSGFSQDEIEGVVTRFEIGEREPDEDSHGNARFLDPYPYSDLHQSLHEVYQDERAQIAQFVDTLYQPINDGDVEFTEVVSGSALIDVARDRDDWQGAAAYLRAVGMPEGHEYVEIEAGPLEAEGALFWSRPDADDPTLPVGEEIDPEGYDGEFSAAMEVTAVNAEGTKIDEGDLLEGPIGEPFTIVSVADGSDALEFELRELVESDMTPEEIAEILADVYQSEQESREGDTNITVEGDDVELGFPSFGLGDVDGSQWLGLGIIAVVVMMIVGFVTDLLPWT
ncbi:hypothetical protein OB919_03045 [Halobacteria archaeon AArc-curdl1]|uniref:Envelope protein N-terminal domain-containing protein n=1 Tax=Natronosalvus hydrolyticus TaxID=2979988 RepID=A0AAP2Z5M0_9EURY|nr:hypothetical protein [Halobacteria archaeon AArc-curdl1]